MRPLQVEGTERGREFLLWSFLLRCIQTQLYIHACTALDCLFKRATCRFFYPWPEQQEQQYDENTNRVALQRRHAPDDRYVVPHNLELAASSPGTVNVVVFDYVRGADQCRSYACKYAGKPEPWYFLETMTPGGEANPVKRFLQSRNVGACMACKRLMGWHIIRSTKDVRFLFTKFVILDKDRIPRSEEHIVKAVGYPDPTHYLNQVQYYFFRNEKLWHMRVEQFFRYFTHGDVDAERARTPQAQRTHDETGADVAGRVADDSCHRHYDPAASALAHGDAVQCGLRRRGVRTKGAVRRSNADLCVCRTPFFEPLGATRESYYEQKLLLALPWNCVDRPKQRTDAAGLTHTTWLFQTTAPDTPEHLQTIEITDGMLSDNETFEQLCKAYETAYEEYVCECCLGMEPHGGDALQEACPCPYCLHAVGWHQCDKYSRPYWREGSLYAGKLDVTSTLWTLARRLVPLEVIKTSS